MTCDWKECPACGGGGRIPALIGTERPPEHVFEVFRKLHGLPTAPDGSLSGADCSPGVAESTAAVSAALKEGRHLLAWCHPIYHTLAEDFEFEACRACRGQREKFAAGVAALDVLVAALDAAEAARAQEHTAVVAKAIHWRQTRDELERERDAAVAGQARARELVVRALSRLDDAGMQLASFAPHGMDSSRVGDYYFADEMRRWLDDAEELLRAVLAGGGGEQAEPAPEAPAENHAGAEGGQP